MSLHQKEKETYSSILCSYTGLHKIIMIWKNSNDKMVYLDFSQSCIIQRIILLLNHDVIFMMSISNIVS